MQKKLDNPHKILTRLIGLNIVYDLFTIPVWIGLTFAPVSPTGSPLTINVSIAIVNAILSAALFTIALLGILKVQKWSYYLTVASIVVLRTIGFFVFALNFGMVIELVWNIVIIFFVYKDIKLNKTLSN